MSTVERDLAIESVASFSNDKALYVLQLTIEKQSVSVYVVQDTRTAVFGICSVMDLGKWSQKGYNDQHNEFKIRPIQAGLAWVSVRKAFALGLPRREISSN